MTAVYTNRVVVDEYLSGVRIDTFLLRCFRNYTPFRMQRMVRAGAARIGDETVPLDRRVFRGEQVEVRLIEPPDKLYGAERIELRVAFEDPAILVIDKPAGLIAHPVGRHESGTLANAVQWHLDRQTEFKGILRPGIVHRLDRNTSGLMVVSKDHVSHRNLSIAFQTGRVSKVYLAIVEGVVEREAGSIQLPIGRVPDGSSVLMSCDADALRAKPARTDYTIVQRFERTTLVEAALRTGRNHQLRVHFAAIGHPVVGEPFYGPAGKIRSPVGRESGRHALHAHRLRFDHPVSGERLEFVSELPRDVREMVTDHDAPRSFTSDLQSKSPSRSG